MFYSFLSIRLKTVLSHTTHLYQSHLIITITTLIITIRILIITKISMVFTQIKSMVSWVDQTTLTREILRTRSTLPTVSHTQSHHLPTAIHAVRKCFYDVNKTLTSGRRVDQIHNRNGRQWPRLSQRQSVQGTSHLHYRRQPLCLEYR